MTTQPLRFDARATGALLGVLALGALLGCTRLGSLDLPLMLANGERILADGAIPRANVFSWANPDHPYLNDKWGFMVLVATVERLGGVPGLALLKATFGAAMAVLLHVLCRRHVAPLSAAGLALVGVTMLSYRLHLRAEWLSYLGTAATLALLPAIVAGSRRASIAQVALIPLWAACHGYWVLGPLLILVAAAAARSWRVAGLAAAAAAAAAISPFGLDNLAHPVRVLLGLSSGPVGDAISELRAPLTGGAPFTFFHALAGALLILALISAARAARSKDVATAALLVVLAGVAVRIDRNLALLGLVTPLAAIAGGRLVRLAAWLGPVCVIVAIGGTLLGEPRIAVDRQFGFGRHEGRFPDAVIASLDPAWTDERYVNDLSIGSYLVRARGTAFIDGNTEGYPGDFLARYRRVLSGEESVAGLDADFPNDGWLLRTSARTTRVLVLGLFLDGTAAPVRSDGVATLFRRGVEPEEADRLWGAWLADEYVPAARAWFDAPIDALDRAREVSGARTGPDEVGVQEIGVLRLALVHSPWHGPFYASLASLYSARNDRTNAARCREYARRLGITGSGRSR